MQATNDCDGHQWLWAYDWDSPITHRRFVIHECQDCGAVRTLAYEDKGKGRLLRKSIVEIA